MSENRASLRPEHSGIFEGLPFSQGRRPLFLANGQTPTPCSRDESRRSRPVVLDSLKRVRDAIPQFFHVLQDVSWPDLAETHEASVNDVE